MDMRIENTKKSRMIVRAKAIVLTLIIGSVVFAAAVFFPNTQPWGYVASPALTGSNFSDNNTYAFTPWFEDGSFRGDLIAFSVAADGSVSLLNPRWRVSTAIQAQHFSTGRNIATTDGEGTATAFLFDSLTTDQQSQVGSEEVVNFVRGDRSNEGPGRFRTRTSVIGDIIHSTPVFQGKPIAGYIDDEYLSFAEDNESRAERVYVGANDGMLHAFDAATGSEVFAYVPSMVIPNLSRLTEDPYAHYYFVDGSLTIGDAHYDDAWHSVLVGGLGAGGKGYFALDVTDPAAASDAAAASKVLWEFHTGSTGGENIGYSYSRPSIVRLKSGIWAAIFGNGYISADRKASLYVVNIQTGELIKELVVNGGANNGLSSPTIIDASNDGYIDTAYAGDLNGNVWKFDLESEGTGGWAVDLSGWPLFTTLSGQAITTAPEVGRHPTGEGLMVYVGTGRLFDEDDGADKTTQAVYGLWDQGSTVALNTLARQELKAVRHVDAGVPTRVASNNRPDWDSNGGWVTNIEIADASALDQGERVLQDLILRDGRIMFMAVNPTIASGENWFMQLDAETGGAPNKTVADVNQDLELNTADNVDGDGGGEITDTRRDRVVGQYQQFGLASRPVVGALGGSRDAALINHLAAIKPFPVDSGGDPGLLGGHFDLDTSSAIYDFGAGVTDVHEHEWDDKHDLTTIDYMKIAGGKHTEINHGGRGVGASDPFILTVANTELSPGGVLEINSTSMSVRDYQENVNRYLSDTLLPGEQFPVYKVSPPTAAEAAAGVQELISFKLSFDSYAILSGDLIPTKTGCVKDNDAGQNGEYRNGALMVQALDASDLAAGFSLDEVTGTYVGGSTSLDAANGYATAGLFWESTVFWHWDGDCYGAGDWEQDYTACIIDGSVDCIGVSDDQKEKAKKKKKKKKCKDDCDDPTPPADGGTPGGETGSGTENDPGHNVSNTTVGGSNDAGRLFWKELIPEE